MHTDTQQSTPLCVFSSFSSLLHILFTPSLTPSLTATALFSPLLSLHVTGVLLAALGQPHNPLRRPSLVWIQADVKNCSFGHPLQARTRKQFFKKAKKKKRNCEQVRSSAMHLQDLLAAKARPVCGERFEMLSHSNRLQPFNIAAAT